MAKGIGNQRFHGVLPGGRAPYYGKDAYTTQMNEYDFRQDTEFPGFDAPASTGRSGSRGRLIEGLSFAAGETKEVPHFLRRNYVGFIPINVRARPCAFSATLTAPQALPGGTTTVTFDSLASGYDRGGDFNTSTNRFTAPETGLYRVSADLALSTSVATSSVFEVKLLVPGRFTLFGGLFVSPTFFAEPRVSFERDVTLNAGDTCEIEAFVSAPETLNSDPTKTFFSVRLVGDSAPYISTSSTVPRSLSVPLYAERALTCDIWVY